MAAACSCSVAYVPANHFLLEDITEDDFIDVIDGNRKYCKCSWAWHGYKECVPAIHCTCFLLPSSLLGIYVYNKSLGCIFVDLSAATLLRVFGIF